MGSTDSEQVCLKWNNFENNLASGFADLLQQEAMVDVTLAAEGKLVQAHKIVLSICSSYFKNIFQMNPCQHPIVILKDVGFQELTDMLDFMYRGEVNVKQQDLPSFLRLAETLKVKGLVGNCSENPMNFKHQTEGVWKESPMNMKQSNLNEGVERMRDVTIKRSFPVVRKKKRSSIDFKNRFHNHKYDVVHSCDNDQESKFSYLNEIECVNIKEERLSDASIDYCNEEVADVELPEIRLATTSSRADESSEAAPQESAIPRRASKPLSFIWSFFNFDCYRNKSECKLCGKVFKACPKTGTASVKYHLHFAHQILRTDGVIQ